MPFIAFDVYDYFDGESMREVVHMRLTGEFSFAEIGEILGRNENWARTTFYRAKLKLMEELK